MQLSTDLVTQEAPESKTNGSKQIPASRGNNSSIERVKETKSTTDEYSWGRNGGSKKQ